MSNANDVVEQEQETHGFVVGWNTPIVIQVGSLLIDTEREVLELNGQPVIGLDALDIRIAVGEIVRVSLTQYVMSKAAVSTINKKEDTPPSFSLSYPNEDDDEQAGEEATEK